MLHETLSKAYGVCILIFDDDCDYIANINHSCFFSSDWITDPLIVPVKELAGHWFLKNLCVLDIAWHPYEPFVLSSGADTTIRLWS